VSAKLKVDADLGRVEQEDKQRDAYHRHTEHQHPRAHFREKQKRLRDRGDGRKSAQKGKKDGKKTIKRNT
jgi:hypothetical protein